MPILTLRQWRLMHYVGIAALYFPDTMQAIEQACELHSPDAVSWVNEAIQQYGNQPLASGLGYANQLSETLMNIAKQWDLERLKGSK